MLKTKKFTENFLNNQKLCISKILNDTKKIDKLTELLISARNQNRTIFTIGNGGSASTASHFSSDLLKTAITKKNKRFKAISLVDNIPVILAWSNDVTYDDVFLEQLKNYVKKKDIIIGFSGSGNSKNMIKAFQYGQKCGAICVGITGKSGGLMKKYSNLCLTVPSDDMLTIESQHLMICHCITNSIRKLGIPIFRY